MEGMLNGSGARASVNPSHSLPGMKKLAMSLCILNTASFTSSGGRLFSTSVTTPLHSLSGK
jgi:hypothetical protein